MGVRSNGLGKMCMCQSACVFMSVSSSLVLPPLLEVNMRQTENVGQGERGSPDRWEKNKWVSFSFSTPLPLLLLSPSVLLSHFLPLFPHLLTPSYNPPPPPLLAAPFCVSCSWAGSHCTERGRTPSCSLLSVSFMPFHSLALFFLWSIYPLFTEVVLRRLRGEKNLFFNRDLISLCSSHSILPLPSSLLRSGFVCCRDRAYSSLWQ